MADALILIGLNAAFWSGIAALVANCGWSDWVDHLLAAAIAGFTAIVVSLEILGLAHDITRAGVALICVSTGIAGLSRWSRRRRRSGDRMTAARVARPAIDWQSAPALVALALSVWAALVYLSMAVLLPVEPVSDAPIYHLFFAARWWRDGSLGLIPTPFGEEGATYFPANGNLWLTWLMATGSDSPIVKAGQWPFLVLGAIALYGIARRARAPWPAAIFPAVVWATLPIVLIQSSIANIDLMWTAFYLAAVYFLLAWIEDERTGTPVSMLFFALASGIVIGSKSVGAVFVVLLLPVAARVLWRRERALKHAVTLCLGLLLPSGYWYVRNIWITGNPVYPLQLSMFGRVLADGWYTTAAMDSTAYHVPRAAWQVFIARLVLVLGATAFFIVITSLASGWMYALRRSVNPTTRRALGLVSTLALVQTLMYWYALPYNTQERFLSPSLGLALTPLASVAATFPLLQTAVCLFVGWQLFGTWTGPSENWFTLLRLYDNPLSLGHMWLTLLVPASLLCAAFALRWITRTRWLFVAMSIALGCYFSARPIIAALADRPLLRFYPQAGFAASLLPGWEILERSAPPAGGRIAYTGTNLPYYLLGIGLRNQVRYININRHSGWLAHDFHLDRRRSGRFELASDPWPQWYRTEADFDAWLANLRAERIEFLFVARENRHGRLELTPGELPRFPIEKEWADSRPDVFVDLGPSQYAPGTIPWVRVYRLISTP